MCECAACVMRVQCVRGPARAHHTAIASPPPPPPSCTCTSILLPRMAMGTADSWSACINVTRHMHAATSRAGITTLRPTPHNNASKPPKPQAASRHLQDLVQLHLRLSDAAPAQCRYARAHILCSTVGCTHTCNRVAFTHTCGTCPMLDARATAGTRSGVIAMNYCC